MADFDIDALVDDVILELPAGDFSDNSLQEIAETTPVSPAVEKKDYVPATLSHIKPENRPKNACARCKSALWFALKTDKDGVYRLKASCLVLHEIVYDGASTSIPVVMYCDGVEKDD